MATGSGGSVTVIPPSGEDAVINITKASGASFTAYSDAYLSSSYSLPATVTAATTVYVPDAEEYVVSVKVNGQERATDAGGTRTFSPRNGSNLTFSVSAGVPVANPFNVLASGYYYFCSGQGGAGASTLTTGYLRLMPWYVPNPVTISRIGAEITIAGDAGSKLRLGIYSDNGSGAPGALLLDAGTINGDSATVQEITVSQVLTPGIYWVGGVTQVVTTTQPTVKTRNSAYGDLAPYISAGTSAPSGQGVLSVVATGVTGALPATATFTPVATPAAPRVFVKIA